MADKKKKNSLSKTQAWLLGTTAASLGTGLTASIAQSAADLPKTFGEQTVGKELPKAHKAIQSHFKTKHGINTKVNTNFSGLPMFLPKENWLTDLQGATKGVNISHLKNPDILAHELGHAVDYKKLPGLKSALRVGGPSVGVIAGSLMLRDPENRKYAPAVAAAGFAPMLYQEAKASVIGQKAVKEVLGNKAAKAGTVRLLKAFGTYAAMPVGAALGIGAVAKHLDNRKKPVKKVKSTTKKEQEPDSITAAFGRA